MRNTPLSLENATFHKSIAWTSNGLDLTDGPTWERCCLAIELNPQSL